MIYSTFRKNPPGTINSLVLEYLDNCKFPKTCKEIAIEVGCKAESVSQSLYRLGKVEAVKRSSDYNTDKGKTYTYTIGTVLRSQEVPNEDWEV